MDFLKSVLDFCTAPPAGLKSRAANRMSRGQRRNAARDQRKAAKAEAATPPQPTLEIEPYESLVADWPERAWTASLKMNVAMAAMGMGQTITAVMLEFAEIPRDDIAYVAGPKVIQRSGWQDLLPTWIDRAVLVERTALVCRDKLLGQRSGEVATADIVAALQGASMEMPLPTEYAELYIWATIKTCARHCGRDEAELRKAIHSQSWYPDDDQFLKPNGRYRQVYREVAEKIRRRATNEGKKRIGPARPRPKPSEVDPPQAEIAAE